MLDDIVSSAARLLDAPLRKEAGSWFIDVWVFLDPHDESAEPRRQIGPVDQVQPVGRLPDPGPVAEALEEGPPQDDVCGRGGAMAHDVELRAGPGHTDHAGFLGTPLVPRSTPRIDGDPEHGEMLWHRRSIAERDRNRLEDAAHVLAQGEPDHPLGLRAIELRPVESATEARRSVGQRVQIVAPEGRELEG